MTEHKFQISDKRGDMILLARGDTLEELITNWSDLNAYADTVGSVPKPTPQPQPTGQTSAAITKLIEVESIEYGYEAKNGSNNWKVKGGWATKHGIPVWDEVLEASGIPPDKLKRDEENIPHEQWIAKYEEWETEKGTRRKVVALEKAA